MIEAIAIIFSLISTYQAYKKNIWSWVTGMIGVIAYFIIFYQDRNWANVVLQVIFVIQYIYGWFVWKKDERVVSLSSFSTIIRQIALIILLYVVCYYLNVLLKGNLSILDATTTALSLVAMVLLAQKKIENWVYFIIADILYVILFICSKHIGSALLYLTFGILAIIAVFVWGKEIKGSK